ncbi:MAG: hypothetical protein GY892_02105 [Shimia sp.]|nr:hypothetical protein [Shimia sp.]
MSRKVCVLGNSHIAALKGGWETASPAKQLDPDFFGALSKGMETLALIDGKLLPSDPEAAAFFCDISGKGIGARAEDYEAFVLCGMGMFPNPVFNNYASYATPSTCNTNAAYYVSDACLDDLLWDHIDRSMMMHCARLVRGVTDAPVHLVWQAFWSEALINIQWRADQMAPIVANGDQEYIHARMRTVETRLANEGFSVLTQPEDTLTQGVMTKKEYSRGSVLFREGLNQPHRDNDVFHMNSDYGAKCWNTWSI